MIKFGPAGLGSVKTAEEVLERYKEYELKVCEIAFTYSVYIKNKEDAKRIRKKAKELGIDLTIHASYYVNLNSSEQEKVESSKKRILKCAEIGEIMGAKVVVFHPGYYGKDRQNAFSNIKLRIKEMQDYVKKKNWKIKLAPETMGKVNVFGSPEEISNLVRDTGCSFCLDFAHILAREKKVDFKKIKKLFPYKNWHCHFSGIEYGEKGEKYHKRVEKSDWKKLLKNLPKNKNISIICESPSPIEDSIQGLKIYEQE